MKSEYVNNKVRALLGVTVVSRRNTRMMCNDGQIVLDNKIKKFKNEKCYI